MDNHATPRIRTFGTSIFFGMNRLAAHRGSVGRGQRCLTRLGTPTAIIASKGVRWASGSDSISNSSASSKPGT